MQQKQRRIPRRPTYVEHHDAFESVVVVGLFTQKVTNGVRVGNPSQGSAQLYIYASQNSKRT